MQKVTDTYVPYTDIRTVEMRVSFGLIDTTAAEVGTPATTHARYPTQLEQIMTGGKMTQHITDLTPNQWILDGTNRLLPKDTAPIHTGYRSKLSDERGKYQDERPKITVEFPEDISCIGFTVNFDETAVYTIASRIKVITYDETGTVVTSAEHENDRTIAVLTQPSYKFRRAEIIFLSVKMPYSSIHVASIIFGIEQKFTPDNIVSCSLIQEISLDMSTFPANQFSFTFENLDKSYNIVNPNGVFRFLQDQQRIKTEYIINGEVVDGGEYLFKNSTSSNDGITAGINAGDFVEILDGATYEDTETGTWTFADAVNSVIAKSGLNVEMDIPTDIGVRIVRKGIPENTKSREALRLLAQAARCVIFFNRKNVLTARDLNIADAVDSLTADNASDLSGISDTGRINTVILTIDNKSGEEKITYTAQELEDDEMPRIASITNPCVHSGQEVAEWILAAKKRRIKFTVPARGNPALDPGDVITIDNIFDITTTTNITRITTIYNGGLNQTIEAQAI